MHKDIKEILFSADTLDERVKLLGQQITKDYKGEDVVFIGILKGSFMFLADIVRNTALDCTLDFVTVQSYGDSTVSGELSLTKDISVDIRDKNVILVEDILDTGKTLAFLKQRFAQRQPKSLRICTLLDKKVEKADNVKADYTGFEIGNEFVVGYGLDYAQRYRNLPYIGILKKSAIN